MQVAKKSSASPLTAREFFRKSALPGKKAVFDFQRNIVKGDLESRTATRLVREWIDIHVSELEGNWKLAQISQQLKDIDPLS